MCAIFILFLCDYQQCLDHYVDYHRCFNQHISYVHFRGSNPDLLHRTGHGFIGLEASLSACVRTPKASVEKTMKRADEYMVQGRAEKNDQNIMSVYG